MNDQITCPHCGRAIPISDALKHQSEAMVKESVDAERAKMVAFYKKRLDEEKKKNAEELAAGKEEFEKSTEERIRKRMELQMKNSAMEREEMEKQNKELQTQLLEAARQKRQILNEREQQKIEFEKKLSEEQEKIRTELQKQTSDEYRLKLLEKDQKLEAVLKANEELKRKIEQGSQQTQGEVLELEIEQSLRHEFPYDEIVPVPKGVRGADLMQIVKNQSGRVCGTIIWETKRTKSWSAEWVVKLKDDQRQVKAELAVIVSRVLPENIRLFGNVNGVWVCDYSCIMGVAVALRSKLLEVAAIKASAVGKNEKMEVLYNYLSGTEFKQRVEAIVESFRAMQDDIKKERTWFMAKWARQEKNIAKVVDNTFGMQGDLQGIMGKALPAVEGVELPASSDEDEEQMKLE